MEHEQNTARASRANTSRPRIDPGEVAALSDALKGRLISVGDAGYEQARSVWNGLIDVRPALIAQCHDTSDVLKAVCFAAEQRLFVSVRGGGHNVAGMALTEGGLVVDLRSMREVHVDASHGIASAQGGAQLGDIDAATQRHGLVLPSGFVSQTGLGGLLLRGGLGHTMRRFGLTCDHLVAVNVVTSDRRVRRISAEDDPELFWALRGGPVNVGAITSFELTLHRLSEDVRLVFALYPAEKGVALNRLLQDQMARAPRELGMISMYATLPDSEELPAIARGREVVGLFGMYSGDRADAEEVLAPFLAHPDLVLDLGGWMPYTEAQQALDKDYPSGMRYYWKSVYLNQLGEEALQVIHRFGRARPSRASTLDVWALGGAIDDPDQRLAAFPHRHAKYLVAIEANWDDPAQDEQHIGWARSVHQALAPDAAAGAYLNFPGSRREHDQAVENLQESVKDRLRAVQRRMDPAGLFARSAGL